jgi:hypothetical protein
MEQSYIIGGSIGGTVGLLFVYCCVKFCKIIISGSCIDSRNRIHVEVGDEKSMYHVQADTTIQFHLGNRAALAKKEESEKQEIKVGRSKETEENPK